MAIIASTRSPVDQQLIDSLSAHILIEFRSSLKQFLKNMGHDAPTASPVTESSPTLAKLEHDTASIRPARGCQNTNLKEGSRKVLEILSDSESDSESLHGSNAGVDALHRTVFDHTTDFLNDLTGIPELNTLFNNSPSPDHPTLPPMPVSSPPSSIPDPVTMPAVQPKKHRARDEVDEVNIVNGTRAWKRLKRADSEV
ncbi:hypothetical protein B0H10DRAFT_1961899 [Mycena sp. CBHHK59/15]|nr:hypothetical protein B0H10DRAFT_1961899 [Mycena sp. CBHHK59/15]